MCSAAAALQFKELTLKQKNKQRHPAGFKALGLSVFSYINLR